MPVDLTCLRRIRYVATPLLLSAAVLLAVASCDTRETLAPASHIFFGGRILTLDPERPHPGAVAIGDGRILAIGARQDLGRYRGPATIEVDLAGRTLAPAFVDHHVHLLNLGLSLLYAAEPPAHFIDVTGLATQEGLAETVRGRAASLPAESWILGKGWSQGAWGTGRLPTHELLSAAAPRHPVYMTRVDAHAGWINSEGMRRAGMTSAMPDPAGGVIGRLPNGGLSGLLLERANELVRPVLPEPTREEIQLAFGMAAEALFAQGVTEVFDAGFLGPPGIVDLQLDLETYLELLVESDLESPLPLRVNLMIPAPTGLSSRLAAEPQRDRQLTPRIRITHFKLFVDGALGSRGALLTHPYADDPHTFGVERMSRSELHNETLRAIEADLDVATHAIGDAAVARALDVYEEILADRPTLSPTRLRIEHFSYAAEEDMRRAADLGIVLSVNPDFVAPDDSGHAMEDARVGSDRSARVYAFGSLDAAGGKLAFGSDYFTTPLEPLATYYGAVTRRNSAGFPTDGWHPQEILPRARALRILSSVFPGGGAMRQRGALTVGGPADLVVLSDDPLTAPDSEILGIRVEATYAGVAGLATAQP